MKKYLWVHFKAFDDIKGESDQIKLSADEFWYGTEKDLEDMAAVASEWHQFKEVDERLA